MAKALRIAPLLRGRVSPGVYTNVLTFLVLAPALILAAYLAVSSAHRERAQLEQSAQNQNRKATTAIEHEIIAVQNVLLTLTDSYFLQIGDFASFYREAANASHRVGAVIVLRDAHLDRQVINTALPWGTLLSGATKAPRSPAQEEKLRSGRPIVTNVFFGSLLNEYAVSIVVPVIRDGDLQYALSAGIPLQRFAEILAGLNIRPHQIVGVIDQNGIFVARSAKHNEFAGRAAVTVPPAREQGVVDGTGGDGNAFHAFFWRSDLLGWTIATGVSDSVLDAPMKRALAILAAAGGLLVVAAVSLARVWGRRLSQSVGALGIDRKPTREEFEILFNSSPNGVMVIDGQGRIVMSNAGGEEKFGYMRGELIGQPVEAIIPERFRKGHTALRQAFALDPQSRAMGGGRDLYGRRKDGSEFPVEVGLNPINSGDENLVLVTVVDVSRRMLAAQQLAATTNERDDLRRRLINAQEQERLRLAHELHDQTGQSLTAAMLEIKAIEDAVKEPDRTRFRLLRLQLDQVGQTLHRIAWELRPASIDEIGLAGALADYLETWSKQFDIEVDLHCTDSQINERSEEIHTTIYRVVQEALTNVAKHARRATNVSVILECTAAKLRLTIEDNGCGFDTATLTMQRGDRKGGLGIAGMRERLTLIGGEFEIESSEDIGTTIFARIPVEEQRTAA